MDESGIAKQQRIASHISNIVMALSYRIPHEDKIASRMFTEINDTVELILCDEIDEAVEKLDKMYS